MTFLDANVFLRFLTRDDEVKAEACRGLMLQLDAGDVEATTSESVLAEVAYVLSARSGVGYALSPAEVAARLKPLLSMPGLKLANKRSYQHALDLYAAHPFLDFEDALTVAHVARQRLSSVTSYDRDFDRVEGVNRQEP